MNFFNNLITAISGEVMFLPRRTVAASTKKAGVSELFDVY